MNDSEEIGFIYSSDCSVRSQPTLNGSQATSIGSYEWDIMIGIVIGIMLSILLLSIGAATTRFRQRLRLRRVNTVRNGLDSLC